LKICLAEGPN